MKYYTVLNKPLKIIIPTNIKYNNYNNKNNIKNNIVFNF